MSEMDVYASLEAEISTLGAAMQDRKAAMLVAELEQADYTSRQNQAVYVAIKHLLARDEPIDLLTTSTELGAMNALEAVGGNVYLMRMISMVPTTANVKSYINIVRECSSRRQLRALGEALMRASGDASRTVEELREKTALQIRQINASKEINLIRQYDALLTTYGKLEEDQKHPDDERTDRIMTGIGRLDERIGGLKGSKLVVIGARPAVGKSIFALNICVNAAKHGKRVLMISLEMDEEEITERILANESDVSLTEITSGEITDEGWQALAQSTGPVSKFPIWYCTEADTVEKVRKAAFQLYESEGLDMICVDYMQLMSGTFSKSQKRAEQVAEISRGLKKLTQELKIPILALTQLNRNSEDSRSGKKREPTMAEARESGSIEQDANIFILLHQPDIIEMRDDMERETWKQLKANGMSMMRIIVDKNRQGTRGKITVAFDGKHMRFLPLTRMEPPA